MGVAEESSQAPRPTRSWSVPPGPDGTALALHGGAGGRILELSREEAAAFEAGLRRAHDAGSRVLAAGGSALDAVCATVEQLEDDPLFNAGRGAALTADGHAELDAAVMTGSGRAGAVAVSRHARNPVLAARAVLEETDHVLLVDPAEALVAGWGLVTVEPAYFVTEARRQQLARVRADLLQGARHGTVGAVARDRTGAVAAATSTGGMVNQTIGRVGDTPVLGAGTYARDGIAAVSCTGEGESFLRGVVAHDIASRVRYLGSTLEDAVLATVQSELTERDASGGLVAVGGDGTVVVAHNSPTLFAAFVRDGGLVVLT
jgi:beta-aspartyl-peptidase (threonine type)